MVQLMTNFAERTTDEGTSQADLLRQADLRSGMLVRQFGIGSGDSASAGIQVPASGFNLVP